MLYAEFDNWYKSQLGQIQLASEQAFLDNILPTQYGRYLLQPASSFAYSRVAESPITDQISLWIEGRKPIATTVSHGKHVIGHFTELPFLPDSLDLILLPHLLEFTTQPQEVLKECYRALKPEGLLIIFGFNPLSFWGFSQKTLRKKEQGPWQGKFILASTLRHWLKKEKFRVTRSQYFIHRPPLVERPHFKKWFTRLRFLEIVGQYCWPGFAGTYILLAQKQTVTVIPLKERRQPRRFVQPINVVR